LNGRSSNSDPVCHRRTSQQSEDADPRWIKAPHGGGGGELKLEDLDLSYSARADLEAPFQMKANMGMFLIDDFGRQQVSTTDLLNRWIVPLEMRVDFLAAVRSQLEVPFDELVLSSNLGPKLLMDEAFRQSVPRLRRDPDRAMLLRDLPERLRLASRSI
jgi:predicted ATPase with chaperone activity